MSTFPAEKFVTLTLETLTHLAMRSLADVHSQIELLIHHLRTDPRNSVKLTSLKNLNLLARKSPQLWKYNSVEVMIFFLLKKLGEGRKGQFRERERESHEPELMLKSLKHAMHIYSI